MTTDPPAQTHSNTSVEAGRALSRRRLLGQERWVYEALRLAHPTGKADWELWEIAQTFSMFDKLSSLHRARIGLVWQSRVHGATPWHPVEDSGRSNHDPRSTRRTTIWQLKDRYSQMPYDVWAKTFRSLAKGRTDLSDLI